MRGLCYSRMKTFVYIAFPFAVLHICKIQTRIQKRPTLLKGLVSIIQTSRQYIKSYLYYRVCQETTMTVGTHQVMTVKAVVFLVRTMALMWHVPKEYVITMVSYVLLHFLKEIKK